VTGDDRSGLLALRSLGRTRILTPREFCDQVLR
jgi:predicted nucleic acid-binding protein